MALVWTNGGFLFTVFCAVAVVGLTTCSVAWRIADAFKWSRYYKHTGAESVPPIGYIGNGEEDMDEEDGEQ